MSFERVVPLGPSRIVIIQCRVDALHTWHVSSLGNRSWFFAAWKKGHKLSMRRTAAHVNVTSWQLDKLGTSTSNDDDILSTSGKSSGPIFRKKYLPRFLKCLRKWVLSRRWWSTPTITLNPSTIIKRRGYYRPKMARAFSRWGKFVSGPVVHVIVFHFTLKSEDSIENKIALAEFFIAVHQAYFVHYITFPSGFFDYFIQFNFEKYVLYCRGKLM